MSVNERKYDFPLCLIRDDHGRICGREASYFDLGRGAWVCAAHGATPRRATSPSSGSTNRIQRPKQPGSSASGPTETPGEIW